MVIGLARHIANAEAWADPGLSRNDSASWHGAGEHHANAKTDHDHRADRLVVAEQRGGALRAEQHHSAVSGVRTGNAHSRCHPHRAPEDDRPAGAQDEHGPQRGGDRQADDHSLPTPDHRRNSGARAMDAMITATSISRIGGTT